MVVHALKEKDSKENISDEEPPSKRLKFLIPNPIISSPNPLRTILPQNISLKQFTDNLFQTTSSVFSPTPPSDESKGKGIATEENPLKELIPLMDEGGSAKKEKSEKKLKKVMTPAEMQAQAQKLAEYEAKRA
ncbi:hypothetical protein Tco_0453559 [Tanacetum coccineum]